MKPPTSSEERALAQSLRARDRAALETLYRRHAEVVYRVALRLLGDRQGALDVMQETFLKAWDGAGGFRGESGLRTWLVRIALNQCYRALRHRRRRAPLEEAGATPASGAGADPARDAERARMRAALDRAVEGLPADWRTALVLRDALGFSYQEMSEAINCPLGTVRSRLFRARAALRERLGRGWTEGSR